MQPLLFLLLERLADPSSRVQLSACAALSTVLNEVHIRVAAFLGPLCDVFTSALGAYGEKSSYALLRAIRVMAENVGPPLAEQQYAGKLLPALFSRWERAEASPKMRGMPSVLDCMQSVARAMGAAFVPHTPEVHKRVLNLAVAATQHQDDDTAIDILLTGVDLIGALYESTGGDFVKMLPGEQVGGFSQLLTHMQSAKTPALRQSCLAAYGDIVRNGGVDSLRDAAGSLDGLVQFALTQAVDTDRLFVSANAVWVLGEMFLYFAGQGDAMARYGPTCAETLLPLLALPQGDDDGIDNLLDNVAVAVGRMGLTVPEVIAPRLGDIAELLFHFLAEVRDPNEKDSALRGMLNIAALNPAGIVNAFGHMCVAFSSSGLTQVTRQQFEPLLDSYKTSAGQPKWLELYHALPAATQDRMARFYRVS